MTTGDAFLTAGDELFATFPFDDGDLTLEGGDGALLPATRLLDRLPLALEGVTLLLLPLPLFDAPFGAGCSSSSASSARKRAGVTPFVLRADERGSASCSRCFVVLGAALAGSFEEKVVRGKG